MGRQQPQRVAYQHRDSVVRTGLESLAQVHPQFVELFGCGRLGHGPVERSDELTAPVAQLGGLGVSLFPSSLGLSFAVVPGTTALDVVVEWGEYDRVDNPTPESDRPEWQQNIKLVWRLSRNLRERLAFRARI